MLLAIAMNPSQYAAYQIFSTISLLLMFLAALVAVIVVLFQQSNSDGIQGITASSETFFGKNKGQSMEEKLKKYTWISLGVLAGLALISYIIQLIIV